MNLRLNILLFILITFTTAKAQDKIIKVNGRSIIGKVHEVGINRVTYHLDSSTRAAAFIIKKKEISRILFENGSVTDFEAEVKLELAKKVRIILSRRNLINFSPSKFFISGPGVGVSYERILDNKGRLGFIFPVSYTIADEGIESSYYDMLYFSPGLKIYPFKQRNTTYAVGPTLFYGISTGKNKNSDASKHVQGLLINNYVNFQITSKFQIGMNLGIGTRYDSSNYVIRNYNNLEYSYRPFIPTLEFNFNLGFRF